MGSEIGEVNYKQCNAQKLQIKKKTEKSINSLFERNVINEAQRDKLLQMYFRGEVSFGDDGLTAEEARNFTQETYNEIEANASKQNDNKSKTMYIIQPGDTPKVIAEKLGLKGDEARNFATKIQAQAIKDGMYHKYGFAAGDMIQLPGDFQAQIEALKNNGEYLEASVDINTQYKKVRSGQVENKTPVEKTEEPKVDENKLKQDKIKAEELRKNSDEIAASLEKTPSPSNSALSKIDKNNVVFVLALYNKRTSRNLARDLINNGDKNLDSVKNNICYHLAARGQELNVSGIYFSDYMKIKDADKLLDWIENAKAQVGAAEKKNNPAVNNVLDGKIYYKKRKDINDIKSDGKKIANELFKEIDGAGSDSEHTKELLKKIKPENAAYVVTSYRNAKVKIKYKIGVTRTKENSSHRELAKDIVEEYGLNINDVKNNICKNLYTQAKNLGLTYIYFGDYQKIDDIDKLCKWINKASDKIISAMENVEKTPENKTNVETTKEGEYKLKTTTNKPIFEEAGISKVVEKYDSNNKLVDTTTYFEDGKVVREYQDEKRGRVRELVQRGNSEKPQDIKIKEPIDMKIELPQNASENAKKFAKALEENKKELMEKLNLDNDTYDKFAKLAMAIAEQETNFGNNGGMYRSYKYDVAKYAPDTSLHDWSYGPTQIKFEFFDKNEWCADKFKQFGINEGVQLFDMEKSAIATMIVLTNMNDMMKGKRYQDGMEAARGKIVTNEGWEMQNGHLEKTDNTKSYVNKVTDEDALCYAWNKGLADIKDGTMEPEAFEYTRNIHKYLEKYSVKDVDPSQRKTAVQKSKAKQAAKNFKPMDNNGPIGSVVFMPKMYGYTELKDQSEELEVLKTSLSKNSKIDQNSKRLLILAVEHGEIGFEFGLTSAEADSLTQKDVDMMLSHVGNLKSTINSRDKNINFEDGINSTETVTMKNKYMQLIKDAELSFKKSYLASKTPSVSTSGIPQENILNTPMNNDMTYSKRAGRRGFAGNIYDRIPDEGVNSRNTSEASKVLAEYAQKTARNMNTSGYCMTGFRAAIRNAGIDDSDLKEGKPRATVGFFERHPDMFEEVKFINVGGGSARQINSTDLPNLPAGYIVIWIPDQNDKNFKDLEGHISITNGNGQAYADETDNLDWGVYHGSKNSGKGEHGTFRVFRLTDKWKVEDAKLKFAD